MSGLLKVNLFSSLVLFVAVVFPAIIPCRGDVVYLAPESTSFTLEGEIIEENDEYIVLRIPDDTGKIRIPWTRIIKIERDINIADIPEDDFKAFYENGLKAIKYQLWDKAEECFLRCAGKPDIAPDAWKYLGVAHDNLGNFRDALQAWDKYKREVPDDEEINLRYDEIKQKMSSGGETIETSGDEAYDGMEKFKWRHETWSNKVKIVIQDSEDAGKVLTLDLADNADKGDKAAVSLSMRNAGFPKGIDLTDSASLEMRVYVAGDTPMNIAVALLTGKSHEWYESRQKMLKPGTWQQLTFPLDKDEGAVQENWKSKATGWRYTTPLKDRQQVYSIVLLLYNRGRPGTTVHVDRIYFKPKDKKQE